MMLGIASWQFKDYEGQSAVSWTFILVGFLAVLVGRGVNIGLTTLLFYFCVGKKKWRVNNYELEIIGVSGMVKGAVPYALMTTLALNSSNMVATLKSTVIAIVFISSLFLNGLVPMFIHWRLKIMK